MKFVQNFMQTSTNCH